MRPVIFTALFFLVWRILLLVPLAVGNFLFEYRQGYDYTNIWKFTKQYFPVDNFFLYPWANFDGIYYLAIAGGGYTRDNAGFMPLFPFLIHIFSSLFEKAPTFGSVQFFTALFIANLSFFLSLIFLYKLIRLDYSHHIAMYSIIFLLIFPTSFYFGSIYSESLFLLLLVLSFYFARKKQWIVASIFGMLLALTRIVGIAIFAALVYEFFAQGRRLSIRALPLILVPAGIIGYALFNLLNWGDPAHFLRVHETLNNSRSADSIVLFPQTVFRYAKILTSVPMSQYEWWIALLEITTFFVVAFLFYVGWQKRIRLSYLIFALLSFLIPVSSGTFSGLPRYSAVLFPIFIALALVNRKAFRLVYIISSLVLIFILLMLFSRGYYVS